MPHAMRGRSALDLGLIIAGFAVMAGLVLFVTRSLPPAAVAVAVDPAPPPRVVVSITSPAGDLGGATLACTPWVVAESAPQAPLAQAIQAPLAQAIQAPLAQAIQAPLVAAPVPTSAEATGSLPAALGTQGSGPGQTQVAELPGSSEPPASVAATPGLPEPLPGPAALGTKRSLFRLPGLEPGKPRSGGLTILQIGDSHTAADFFTGEVRQLLQARFGDGGPGYLNAGKPHPGVRSAIVKVSASPGWTYSALQKTEDTDQFYLSGFNATVSGTGETLSFAAGQPSPYDMIEIEAIFGPGHGGVRIAIDDLPPVQQTLDGQTNEKRVFRVTPAQGARYDFRKLTITTTGNGPVTIASVGVFNHAYGVSYSAIGFPGATVDIANQINAKLFGEELHRIDPHIVVLAFGTNEGFNDNLDLARYGERYRMVLKKVRDSLPGARIVMVAPPNANRLPGRCKAAGVSASCKPPGSEDQGCFWSTPPLLDKVRDLQRKIASEAGVSFWNWGDLAPGECAAHGLVTATPKLMAADHVHFTGDGYRLGARAFAKFLTPLIDDLRLKDDAVSNR